MPSLQGHCVRRFKHVAFSIFAGIAAVPFAWVAAGVLGLSQVIAGAVGGMAMAILVALILIREGRRAA
jgi:hypothetical protein